MVVCWSLKGDNCDTVKIFSLTHALHLREIFSILFFSKRRNENTYHYKKWCWWRKTTVDLTKFNLYFPFFSPFYPSVMTVFFNKNCKINYWILINIFFHSAQSRFHCRWVDIKLKAFTRIIKSFWRWKRRDQGREKIF